MHNFFSRGCKYNWNESTMLCCQLELISFAVFHSAWFVNHSFINARWILNFSTTCNSWDSQIILSVSIDFYSLILWNLRSNMAFLFFFFSFCSQNRQSLQCWVVTVIEKTLEKNVENWCKLVGVLLCIINFTLPIVLLWKAQNGDAPHCHRQMMAV